MNPDRGAAERVGTHQVVRDIIRRPGRYLLRAPQGYGKTKILSALEMSTDARYVDPRSVHAQFDTSSDVLLCPRIDTWPIESIDDLCLQIPRLEKNRSVVMTAFDSPRRLNDLLSVVESTVLTVVDLRISASVLDQMLQDLGVAPAARGGLVSLIDGWPRLAERMIEAIGTQNSGQALAAQISIRHATVQDAVDGVLRPLDADDRSACGQLAHLDSFSESTADVVCEGVSLRLRSSGVPVEAGPDGRLRFLAPIRETLRLRSDLDPGSVDRLVASLIEQGDHLPAARLLVKAGRLGEAARTLVAMPAAVTSLSDPDVLIGTLTAVAAHFEEFPQLLLVRSRSFAQIADTRSQRGDVEQAVQLAPPSSPIAGEAQIELVYLDAMQGADSPELRERLERVRTTWPSGRVGARALESDALLVALGGTDDDLEQALALLRQAKSVWDALGENLLAATVLRGEVLVALLPLGRFREAEVCLREALELARGVSQDRIRSLVVLTQVLAASGQVERHGELAEAAALAESLNWSWAEAYVASAATVMAGLRGDADGVRRLGQQAWESLGTLQEHPTGSIVRASQAEAAALSDDFADAERLVDAVMPVERFCRRELFFARLALASGRGDRSAFEECIANMVESDTVPASLRWRVDLYWARLLARCGDDPTDRFEAAKQGAELVGATRVVELLAPSNGRPKVLSSDRGDNVGTGVRIELLGSLRVVRDGEEVRLPGDMVRRLVEMLAMSGEAVHVELVLDRLWPDADVASGRRRLKNVVLRSRSVLGDCLVRTADTLSFAPSVEVDLQRFQHAARKALHLLASSDDAALSAAVNALSLYSGPLLSDRPYDEDVEARRRGLTVRALSLFDAVVDLGDSGLLAPMLFDALMTIDSSDLARLVALRSWCEARSVDQVALEVGDRIEDVARELGVPSPG